jgi:LysM repeat protein/beta-lactamase class D
MLRRSLTVSPLAAAFAALLIFCPSPAAAQNRQYKVVRGDSLSSVARKFRLSISDLAAVNELSTRAELRIGQTLTIPGTVSSTSSAPSKVASTAPHRYTVRSGDSLTRVAREHGLSIQALAAANDLGTDEELLIGRTLTIPAANATATPPSRVAPSRSASGAPHRYTVRRGDTLSSIARRFGVGIDELRAWNGLTGSNLLAGVTLIVNADAAPDGVVVSPPTPTRRAVITRVSTYADSSAGDVTAFDDPVVRDAAVAALGRYNGSVVAIDPNSGRILTIVNQKLAFSEGFIPCSTIKPVIAVAALEESVIRRDTMIKVGTRNYMNLVEAMARSNNFFFEELGRRMGFDTVAKYARLLGLGELAGYNLPNEQPGALPTAPPRNGGVARMSSFGEGIQMTPLQLASLVSTLANGGTMYYLQYPRSAEELQNFEPRIKRRLDIEPLLPDIRDGMLAAVLYGTGKGSYAGEGEQPLGKTGTCSDSASRLGWFVSYADQENPKIVLAILVRGRTTATNGPFAAQIAGKIYQRLHENNFFTDRTAPASAQLSPFGN